MRMDCVPAQAAKIFLTASVWSVTGKGSKLHFLSLFALRIGTAGKQRGSRRALRPARQLLNIPYSKLGEELKGWVIPGELPHDVHPPQATARLRSWDSHAKPIHHPVRGCHTVEHRAITTHTGSSSPRYLPSTEGGVAMPPVKFELGLYFLGEIVNGASEKLYRA